MTSDDDMALLRLRNLRDLGGLPTRGGGIIAPRRFYRSSAPSRFGVAQRRALTSLGLRNVIDLRSTGEALTVGNTISLPGARVVRLPLFEKIRHNWVTPTDQTAQTTAICYLKIVEEGLNNLARVVQQLTQPGFAPFLVCCSAGRDRTGIVVACLLDLLDVPDEAIATDYARSDQFDPQTGRAYPETITEFLQLLRNRHGSVQDLLTPQGITDDLVQTLRNTLLLPIGTT